MLKAETIPLIALTKVVSVPYAHTHKAGPTPNLLFTSCSNLLPEIKTNLFYTVLYICPDPAAGP